MVSEAGALNIPVSVAPGSRADGSLLTVDDPCIVMETVKLSEDQSSDLIVRLYESMNGSRRTALRTAFALDKVWRCNMLEEPEAEISVENGAIPLDVRPFEIVTLRLRKA